MNELNTEERVLLYLLQIDEARAQLDHAETKYAEARSSHRLTRNSPESQLLVGWTIAVLKAQNKLSNLTSKFDHLLYECDREQQRAGAQL